MDKFPSLSGNFQDFAAYLSMAMSGIISFAGEGTNSRLRCDF